MKAITIFPMQNILNQLNSVIILCEELSNFQYALENRTLDKTGQTIFENCGVFLVQGVSYSFMDEEENTDEYKISINLSKKSFIEVNNWSWARIEILQSDKTKKTLGYKVFISDEIWVDVDNNEGFINPSIHMNDIDIITSLEQQIAHTYKLTKELLQLNIDIPCSLENILKEPNIYFNLATEIKRETPVYFNWVLKACKNDTIILKKLKEFILKDEKDEQLSINIKLTMTDLIDKLLLKNDLDDSLNSNKKIKLNKI